MVLAVETLVLERTIIFGVETMVLYGLVVLSRTLLVDTLTTLTTSVNNNCAFRIITKILSIDFGSIFFAYLCKFIILNSNL